MSAPEPSVEEIRAAVAQVVGQLTDGGAITASSTPAGAASSSTYDGPGSTSDRHDGGSWPLSSLAIAADHGGYALKEKLAADLRDRGFTVRDCGTRSTDAVDYPDFAPAVAQLVSNGEVQVGIVIDGAGIGSAMAANKVPGVRAATCWDVSSARNSREHNYANVLSIGAGLLGENLAREVVDTWLSTPTGAARHGRRVDKIMQIEARYVNETGVPDSQPA
jgi:ribose 5-phosphate isomerase B